MIATVICIDPLQSLNIEQIRCHTGPFAIDATLLRVVPRLLFLGKLKNPKKTE